MKYVAAASDKTVSLRRDPWFFRIVVEWNIASLRTGKRTILLPQISADKRSAAEPQPKEKAVKRFPSVRMM
jgi:hypothetical protein